MKQTMHDKTGIKTEDNFKKQRIKIPTNSSEFSHQTRVSLYSNILHTS